jgi:methylmalonyl-CoA/ethylmalonyl-CoA epimerase
MYNKIDHIGIAVKSIEPVKDFFYTVFGIIPDYEEIIEDQKVKIVGFKVGNSITEFLEPIGTDSPISSFLEKRGEGLHHICYGVNDIQEVLTKMKSQGIKLIDEEPRLGADGKKIAFVHPKSFFNVLLELSQEIS